MAYGKIVAIARNIRIGSLSEFGFDPNTRLDPLGEYGSTEIEFDSEALLKDEQIQSCIENGLISVEVYETQAVEAVPAVETSNTGDAGAESEVTKNEDLSIAHTELDLTEWNGLNNRDAIAKINDLEDLEVLAALSVKGKTAGVMKAASARLVQLQQN